MNTEQIEHRIKTLTLERNALEINHEALIKENQKQSQEFQQRVLQNQTRFAQLTGGILELTQLLKPKGDNNEPIHIEHVGSGTAIEGIADRIPGDPGRVGHHSRADLGD
jgi:hypothetical protein